MSAQSLPIAGFPHLSLAHQDDPDVRQRLLSDLKASGFIIEPDQVIPPQGADVSAVIAFITAASLKAHGRAS